MKQTCFTFLRMIAMKRLYAVLLVPLFLINVAYAEADPMVSLFMFQSQMAEQGNVEAIMKLGEMYEEGQGTRLDLDKALEKYREANSKGHKGAEKSIIRVEEKKKMGLKALQEKAAREQAAIEKADREKAEKIKAEQEKAAREKAEQEKLAKEKAAREQAEKEKAISEKIAKEKAIKEQLEKDREDKIRTEKIKAARELAAKERAAIKKTMIEKAEREKLAREKSVQDDTTSQKEKTTSTNDKKDSKDGFSSNPCNTPAARLMSTCK